jgi:hypothetical protein
LELIDALTSMDELLRVSIEQSKTIIELLSIIAEKPVSQSEADPSITVKHVPFYSEDSISSTTVPVVLDVKTDSEQGLGDVGRSGYIINDGVGIIYASIDDGRTGKSKEIRIDAGTWYSIAREDDIWVSKVILRATVAGTNYRCSFSR